MKSFFRFLGLGLLALVGAAGVYAAYVAVTGIPKYEPGRIRLDVQASPQRVARGRKYASMLCAGCHMDPVTGRLTGKHLVDAPAEFGVIYSKNITRDPDKGIGRWTDGELAYLLRTGVDRTGQYLPPWMPKFPHLSEEDLESIIAFVKSDDPLVAPAAIDPPGKTRPSYLSKFLSHTVFQPLPYPLQRIEAPPVSDRVAYGRYLVFAVGCWACHSADFKRTNDLEPEKSAGYLGGGNAMKDQAGQTVYTSNLTADEATGIGRWSEEQFTRAVRTGVRPDRTVLGFPMVPMPELTPEDTGAIYAYLRTVPRLVHAVPRVERQLRSAGGQVDGKTLYERYGCPSCHGAAGVGIADLRQASRHYPSDAQLEAWIRNAPAIKPGTKMPTWDGVIREEDYVPLIAYVKELGRGS